MSEQIGVYHKREHALAIKKKKNAGMHCHVNEAKSITPSKISQSPLEETVYLMILSVLKSRKSGDRKEFRACLILEAGRGIFSLQRTCTDLEMSWIVDSGCCSCNFQIGKTIIYFKFYLYISVCVICKFQ